MGNSKTVLKPKKTPSNSRSSRHTIPVDNLSMSPPPPAAGHINNLSTFYIPLGGNVHT